MAGQPKPLFYVAVGLVVVGLIAFAIFRSDLFAPEGEPGAGGGGGGGKAPPVVSLPSDQMAENADPTVPLTVTEYTTEEVKPPPAPEVTSDYKPMVNNTVRFALNVWAGWAPIIFANGGFDAEKVWTTPAGKEFKVELVLVDDPGQMISAYAAGEVHIGWATLDMVPLFIQGFVDPATGKVKDPRVMPRIYQQVDWSNGGDGIVVRETIKSISDLRGKKIALAQNSPSHYFILNMLVRGGVQPSEVQFVFTQDAFQAAAAFNADSSIAACVSWAPDIYNLEEARGNKLLVTTATANKLIADVWFARADYAKDHPDIIEGLVRGIFDAMVDLKDQANKQKCAELMAAGYNMPASDALAMFGDAHSTNWAENYQFFVNKSNPTNFQRVWTQAYNLYRQIRVVTHRPISFDEVMDYSVIKKLGEEEKYASQVDEYKIQFAPATSSAIRQAEEILTNTVIIHFYPNNWDLYKKINRQRDGQDVEELYDPNVDFVLEEIAKLVGQFGAARVIIEGHTDSSMKGRDPAVATLVKELSLNRANAVKQALVEKFDLDPNQLNVEGLGWDRPSPDADPKSSDYHAKNRRVEVKIFPAEAVQ